MRTTQTRRRVVVDQTELAKAIGTRIRAARLAAGLTQQELAGDRYTKAYISALELGHAKPSMAALDYLAPRLGTRPDRLLGDDTAAWTRVEADLHLAAGRFDEALEAYHSLAAREQDKVRRGELLLGAGEAAVRARRLDEAAGVLEEARRLLEAAGRRADARRARYWQATVHAYLDDPTVALQTLHALLAEGPVEGDDPAFDVRLRIGIAQHEFLNGSVDRARLYLEEARSLADTLDVRRRAAYFDALAKVRSAAGDYEAAIRAGTEALTLLREVGYEVQEACLENELAVTMIAIGAHDRAESLIAKSIATLERLEMWGDLGHSLDTQAMIRLARGDAAAALALVERALAIEAEHGPSNEQVGARITRARSLEALGRGDDADAAWDDAIASARAMPSAPRRRKIISARAQQLAAAGKHAEAYELLASST
jgi:tetratricopeptide (TPR) repeat protein